MKKTYCTRIVALFVGSLFIGGCARSPNLYRVSKLGWQGDSIAFAVAPIDTALHSRPDHAEVECLSCNAVDADWDVTLDSAGNGRLYILEANSLVSARLKIDASRIDTTVLLKERLPNDAQKFYKLTRPLVGRVMLVQLGILYSDSLQTVGTVHADPGDELNIFGETADFYLVHHPMFSEPLYLLKNSAIRLY